MSEDNKEFVISKNTLIELCTEIAMNGNGRMKNLTNELQQGAEPFMIEKTPINEKIRKFETGATRDLDRDKLDYEGFLSPAVLRRYAEYLHKHRQQQNGNWRDSDNWQKGIPKDVYMKSMFRHFMDVWSEHRGIKSREGIEDALCGVMFNSMGYMFEHLKEKQSCSSEDKTEGR